MFDRNREKYIIDKLEPLTVLEMQEVFGVKEYYGKFTDILFYGSGNMGYFYLSRFCIKSCFNYEKSCKA